MPMTRKGKKIMSAMTDEYGKQKGERVFYASVNKGKLTGVEKGQAKSHSAANRTGKRRRWQG